MNTNDNPKISVIIPSYNHGNFIGDAIESVLNQTYKNFELLIADDCSTDNSVEVIKKYNDSRIKFYPFKKNQGAVPTLNFLIKQSKGEYIALLNSDDTWLSEKLEKQVVILEKNPSIGAVFADAYFVNEKNELLEQSNYAWANIFHQENRSSGEWLKRLFFDLNCLCHPSILIRRSIYDKTDLYNPCFRQLPDYLMWVNILKFTSIHVMEDKLLKFRILTETENTSADTPVNKVRNINELILIFRNYFDDMPNDIFSEGFKDFLIKKGELSADAYLCEKAFIYFNASNDVSYIYHLIGIEKIYNLLQNPKTRMILEEVYNFDDKSFFELTGKYEIKNFSNKNQIQFITEQAKSSLRKFPKIYLLVKKIYNKLN